MESECESFAEALGASKTVAQVNAICAGTEVDVIIDSGADISVAPLRLGRLGRESKASGVLMQDAQGWQIRECGSRVIDIEVETVEGTRVVVREKFAVARVESVILSLGRLLRWGWTLGCLDGRPTIERGGHIVPIKLRRNTLMITARVSAIASSAPSAAGIRPLNTYDDLGPLPKEIEGVASRPGWHILSNGLPVQVAHRVTELDLERSLWDMEDWTWVAIFVRVEQHLNPVTFGPRS